MSGLDFDTAEPVTDGPSEADVVHAAFGMTPDNDLDDTRDDESGPPPLLPGEEYDLSAQPWEGPSEADWRHTREAVGAPASAHTSRS